MASLEEQPAGASTDHYHEDDGFDGFDDFDDFDDEYDDNLHFLGMALVTSKDIMVEDILEGITMAGAITLVDTMAAIMAPA